MLTPSKYTPQILPINCEQARAQLTSTKKHPNYSTPTWRVISSIVGHVSPKSAKPNAATSRFRSKWPFLNGTLEAVIRGGRRISSRYFSREIFPER